MFGRGRRGPGTRPECRDCIAAARAARAARNRDRTAAISQKQCSRCGVVKSAAEFYRMTEAPDGLRPECRACAKAGRAARCGSVLVTQKRCSSCRRTKPTRLFVRSRNARDGLGHCCSACYRKQQNARREQHKAEGPWHLWAIDVSRGARHRAKKSGVPCTISVGWLIDFLAGGALCAYCGVACRPGSRHEVATSITLDRLIPDLGYVPSNLVLACHRCNRKKGSLTLEEMRFFLTKVPALCQERQAALDAMYV